MRFPILHDGETAEEMLRAPAMVDVVFILLSFFVMATQFALPERDFAMGHRRPGAAAGAVREDFPSVIPVRLRRSGAGVAITVGQARLADNDFDALRAKLTEINMPGIGVAFVADPDLSVGQVARALDAALASPMKQVSVARPAPAGAAGGPSGATGGTGGVSGGPRGATGGLPASVPGAPPGEEGPL